MWWLNQMPKLHGLVRNWYLRKQLVWNKKKLLTGSFSVMLQALKFTTKGHHADVVLCTFVYFFQKGFFWNSSGRLLLYENSTVKDRHHKVLIFCIFSLWFFLPTLLNGLTMKFNTADIVCNALRQNFLYSRNLT